MWRAYSISQVRDADFCLLAQGELLMEKAAYGLANKVLCDLRAKDCKIPGSTVLLLVGSGNNGGDALYAGAYLARRGVQVTALCATQVHQAGKEAAIRAGVQLYVSPTLEQVAKLAQAAGIWIDGVLGIGAQGALRAPYVSWWEILIQARESASVPATVYALDVPSGIDADTGRVYSPVLPADVTVTMGCVKPGLLMPETQSLVGEIKVVDLGYERVLLGDPVAQVLTVSDFIDIFPYPKQDAHKYTRGVLGMITGSPSYKGAAVLGVGGALNTGVGMVRYWGAASDLVINTYPEVVTALGRVDALVLGSGWDESVLAEQVLTQLKLNAELPEVLPVVLDAKAMWKVASLRQHLGDAVQLVPILTPHRAELNRLGVYLGLGNAEEIENLALASLAVMVAKEVQGIVVAKGPVTVIAQPVGVQWVNLAAPAKLATAGTGDVLAGIIGALIATTKERTMPKLAEIAALGVFLHSRAGMKMQGVRAGELAEQIPLLLQEFLGDNWDKLDSKRIEIK